MSNSQLYNLTQFIINNKEKDATPFALFNEWVRQEKVHITNYDEAIWVLDYINTIRYANPEMLKEAIKIDEKRIEKESYNGKKVFDR